MAIFYQNEKNGLTRRKSLVESEDSIFIILIKILFLRKTKKLRIEILEWNSKKGRIRRKKVSYAPFFFGFYCKMTA